MNTSFIYKKPRSLCSHLDGLPQPEHFLWPPSQKDTWNKTRWFEKNSPRCVKFTANPKTNWAFVSMLTPGESHNNLNKYTKGIKYTKHTVLLVSVKKNSLCVLNGNLRDFKERKRYSLIFFPPHLPQHHLLISSRWEESSSQAVECNCVYTHMQGHTRIQRGLMEPISRRYHGLETSQAVQPTSPSPLSLGGH